MVLSRNFAWGEANCNERRAKIKSNCRAPAKDANPPTMKLLINLFPLLPGLLLISWIPSALQAGPPRFEAGLLSALSARSIGPANMGGRIVALAPVESDPKILYVATASGGLWKTVNNGTTWTPLFDHERAVSLGAVAVSASNPEIVWVGTGEANARNSVSWGDGVYQSVDGGETWRHRGLKGTAHIARIVIHPTNPEIVYVAALGRFWGPNPERGVYKTENGGRSWRLVAFLNEDTGFTDLVMDPADPNTLYAAAYQVRRDAFSGGNPQVQFGPHAGLFKTTDGGATWFKMRLGLQNRNLGRCGLALDSRDPHLLYAVIQTDQTDSRTSAGQAARTNSNKETGGVFYSTDRGENWTKVNDLCPRPFYYGQIRIDPYDPKRIYVLGPELHVSTDGGVTFRPDGASSIHADHHALWIDPRDRSHLILGGDGGLSFSYDSGTTWEHVQNLPIGQFYAIAVDRRKPYWVYGGLQDNGSWVGPSATHNHEGITTADWSRVLGMDGFYCQVEPTNPDTVYAEGQYGILQRLSLRTGTSVSIRPIPPAGARPYRFNWSAPLLLSPHSSQTLYFGGNHLFRSTDRGDHWEVISPDLTLGRPGPSPDMGHTLTTVAESPVRPGVLFVGSDDGRVHVSRDAGRHWTDVINRQPGVSATPCITRLECSHFASGTAYLSLDRHRQEDHRPYLLRTTDYGATWHSLAGDLPSEGPVHVIREDARNPDLLFVGTEFGLFVSLDAGQHWLPLMNGLPTVAIHDLVIHPRDRDLVIATHGRSLYIVDISPLEECKESVLSQPAHLFEIKPATLFLSHGSHGKQGEKSYAASNPPYGAVIYYYLREVQKQPVRLAILDSRGSTIADFTGTAESGLHRLVWGLRQGGVQGALVAPGEYIVRFTVLGKSWQKKFRVESEFPAEPERRAAQGQQQQP
jgi:photosystem II stability/assembly factor-like uncharacterized protein